MRKLLKETPKIYIIIAIAAIVAITSQLYFNVFADNFRISLAVIVLPLLVMTVGEDISTIKICLATSVAVFLLRSTIYVVVNDSYQGIFATYMPNAMFYIFYGIIFSILLPNKFVVSYRRLFVTIITSDFLSNICEICFTSAHMHFADVVKVIATLAGVATVRSIISWFCLVGEKQYRTLLQSEEHEKRYQRLFLMTTGLKNEVYFMKKNSEEIENVMGTAYKLYEKLSSTDLDPEIKNMSLSLAKDVHEIKKDYLRIIRGIEDEISEEYDEKHMKLSDILHILKDTSHLLIDSKGLDINLDFSYQQDFVTNEHYQLMNILKNLVTNAIEAIENGEKGDSIILEQTADENNYIFSVKDNGPGISKRHLPNIFNMGYSTKFDYVTGNIYRGVGLSGVKNTVEEIFGGTIFVTSVFGDGTQFMIRIPKQSVSIINHK